MSEISSKLMSTTEVQERCSTWVESQKKHFFGEDSTADTSQHNEQCDFIDTDTEFDSVSECGTKRRRLGVKQKDEVLNLLCEWKDCTFKSHSMETFVRHVAYHIPQLAITINKDEIEVYVCQWKNCFHETNVADEIARHVNYHSYHTKLKCIGSNIRTRVKLPKCNRDSDWKNIIDVSLPHICRWEECLKVFSNYQLFLYHITAHINISPRGNKVEGGIKCNWTGCSGIYPSLYKLRDHLRCHTKEKLVACPHCGATFASSTKFHMHCKRQIPIDVQGFQCSYCSKFYPTERILRDHMRFHVFTYKCTFCDMSCESPASLAKHIRYRHISSRTYPCQLCDHAAKSQQDLDTHMSVHTNGPNFSCHIEGCLYTCKGAYTLDRHLERAHSLEVRWYCCHECPIKYRKSYRLTKHLIQTHHLQWPNGHKRFQYTRGEDGFYRLQMVRYESIDDENIPCIDETQLPDKKYIMDVNQSGSVMEIKILEDKEETANADDTKINNTKENNHTGRSMPIISNILISIDELDADGNVIKRKIVETQETSELPPSEKPPIILT